MTTSSPGVWMIFLGYGCALSCATPIGRQWASGLSLLLSAMRFFTSSAAHGWYGAPPGVCAPMLPTTEPPGGSSPVPSAATRGGAGPAPRPRPPRPRPPAGQSIQGMISHTPERSGLPSDVRGGGAFRSGLPSGVRGTPAMGYVGHCARARGEAATTTRTAAVAAANDIVNLLMRVFLLEGLSRMLSCADSQQIGGPGLIAPCTASDSSLFRQAAS